MAHEVENHIRYEEDYILNYREEKLFTCRWLPESREPKALVFLCHGYAMECSISMKEVGTRLAKAGFGVYGMDYYGHGKSDGLQGYIPSFDDLVGDCDYHFTQVCEMEGNTKKMRILLGESMGGAVALYLHWRRPYFWDGAILAAPMCKIADDVRPHSIVINILRKLSNIIPTWRIIPTEDIIDLAFREPEIRQQIRSNPYCYKGRPRLKTGNELLNVSLYVEKRLDEVALPFIILHGGDDKVTDPSVSKLLYESASSVDKTLKLYPGMWHSLMYGESKDNIDRVFVDVTEWLDQMVENGNSRRERETKQLNESSVDSN